MGSLLNQAVCEARSVLGRTLVLLSLAFGTLLAVAAAPSVAAEPVAPELPAVEVPAAVDQAVAATPDLPVKTAPVAAPETPDAADLPAPPDVPAPSELPTPPAPAASVDPAPVVESVTEVPAAVSGTAQSATWTVGETTNSVRPTSGDSLNLAPGKPQINTGLPSQLTKPSAIAKTPAIVETPAIPELQTAVPELPLIDETTQALGLGSPMARGGMDQLSSISITVSRIGTEIFVRAASVLNDALLSGASIAGQTAAASSSPSQTDGNGPNGPGPDRAPAQLPISGSAFTSSSSGLFFFGFAALLVGIFGLRAPALSRAFTGSPAGWRPAPFTSLLERPG